MYKQAMLFVTGTTELQKYVYETYHFSHWASAFPIILEKYGYIGFDVRDHNVLRDPSILHLYDIVIVTWLPPEMWDELQVQSLKKYDGLLFLEGPLPKSLTDLAGVKSISKDTLYEADLLVKNKKAFDYLYQNYKAFMVNGMFFRLTPKKITTRKVKECRWEATLEKQNINFDELANRIINAFRIPYLIRLHKGNLVFDFKDTLLLIYFFSVFHQKGGTVLDKEKEILWEAFQNLIYKIKAPLDLVLASQIIQHFFQDRPSIYPSITDDHAYFHNLDGLFSMKALKAFMKALPHMDLVKNGKLRQEFEHLLIQIIMFRSEPDQTVFNSMQETLAKHVTMVKNHPKLTGNHNILEVCILCMALAETGDRKSAKKLLNCCLEVGLDFETGQMKFLVFKGAEIKACKNFVLSPIVPLSFLWVLESVTAPLFIGETFHETYGKDRIDRWAASPFFITQTEAVEAIQEAAFWHDGAPFCDGITRKGKIVTFSFQAFSYIVYYHSMHPLDGPFTDCDASGAMGLMAIFFFLLEQQVKRFNATLYKIEAWPDGFSYALTLRHDVDRFPDQQTFDKLFNFEVEYGLGVSWYWIFNRLHIPYLRAIEESGHEIGLHSMKHQQKDKEREILLRNLTKQKNIYGEFIHGGGGGEYWLGYPSVEYGYKCGFDYVEGMSTLYDYPYRFPTLNEDGTIGVEGVVCLSHTVSVDRHLPPENHDVGKWDYNRVDSAIRNGFYIMVLNHPDQYFDRVFDICTQHLPKEGRLDWTCKQVADWWRSTHCVGNISLCMLERSNNSLNIEIKGNQDVEGLVISVAVPDCAEKSKKNNSVHSETRMNYSVSGLLYKQISLNLKKDRPSFVELNFSRKA